MSKKVSNVLIALLFITGIILLLYPSTSNYISSKNQSEAITNYIDNINVVNDEDSTAIIEEAKKFNNQIYENDRQFLYSYPDPKYPEILNYKNTDIIGIISIPKIKLVLPIYHGTSEEVLQNGIGHMEGSSLPVGGINTHTVLFGHRGLPTAKLFTNLDQLSAGDVIYIQTGNLKLAYEVDGREIVEPKDISKLKVEDGKEYLTLVTCTPYGINTHRLLIKAHGIEVTEEIEKEIEKSNTKIEEYEKETGINILAIVATVLISSFVLITMFKFRLKAKKENRELKNFDEVTEDVYKTVTIKLDEITKAIKEEQAKKKKKKKYYSPYYNNKKKYYRRRKKKKNQVNSNNQITNNNQPEQAINVDKTSEEKKKNPAETLVNTISIKLSEINKALQSPKKKGKITKRSRNYHYNHLRDNNKETRKNGDD